MTETSNHAGGTAGDATWDCTAYGPEGRAVGALCFFSPAFGKRNCSTEGECRQRMDEERQRVFDLIVAGAAAGKPTMQMLAETFTSPDQLLNGDEGPAPAGAGHVFVPGGADSTFGFRAGGCAVPVGDDQCGLPQEAHEAPQ